ncbi:protein shisa-4-like isoform X1 [Gigantopelta aegis]|uniref:protein shisa-4-like isoform X1 n=1 Tax=Gigantopelta aegis TaxID=1735272 RepID=UPI001B889152|nr:protein shisa-4-like isoform X1 [Gigantopelta aegis]
MATTYLDRVYVFGLILLTFFVSGADAITCRNYYQTSSWEDFNIPTTEKDNIECSFGCCGSFYKRYCCSIPIWIILISVVGIIFVIFFIITCVYYCVKRHGRPVTVLQTRTIAGVPIVYQTNTDSCTIGVPPSAMWTPPPAHGAYPGAPSPAYPGAPSPAYPGAPPPAYPGAPPQGYDNVPPQGYGNVSPPTNAK